MTFARFEAGLPRWFLLTLLAVGVIGVALWAGAGTAHASPFPSDRRASEWLLRDDEAQQYRILVSIPSAPAPDGGFPVLYVLDGGAWFGVAAEIARIAELEHGPMIVVGIGYPGDPKLHSTRRTADLTPVPATPDAQMPAFVSRQDIFLKFLRTTLRDDVARRYPVNRGRQALFGHSLAGVFVLHALFTQPESFDAFIAASPSIWWNKPIMEREMEAWLARRQDAKDPRILLEVGGLEQSAPPSIKALAPGWAAANQPPYAGKTAAEIEAEIAAVWAEAQMVENARTIQSRLAAAGVNAPLIVFEGEHHASVIPAALSRAMPVAAAKP